MTPSGKLSELPLQILDPNRLGARVLPTEIGIYKIHIKLNAVELPQSPLRFEADYSPAKKSEAQSTKSFLDLQFNQNNNKISFKCCS